MEPRDYLRAYVHKYSGTSGAAARLGIPIQTLRGVLNGWRGVSRNQAADWAVRSGGELDADKLIWIRPTKHPREPEPRHVA